MATSDKTVKVTLVAVATPYAKGMGEASTATRKLGADIDGVSAKTKGMESGLGKASGAIKGMGIAAGAVAGTALVSFLTDSVKAAGDLEQSVGGVDAVFKGSAKTIHDFGRDSAEAVGLSTNEFNQLVTVTGAMLKNKGLSDFTQKSLDLVKVGADLAAQFGGSTAQAVEALNAAMRGESDPIERYGISLNETAVNAKLAEKGMSGLTGAALDQAKAQARIAIIMQQSADATGAFAREADTLQGQQQRLNAEWENAKAELGQALLPALTDTVNALRGGVDVIVATAGAWEKIPGPVKAAAGALIAFHLLKGPFGSAAGTMRDSLARLRQEMALQQALAGGIQGGYQRLGDEIAKTGPKIGKGAAAASVAVGGLRAAGSGLLSILGGPWGVALTGAAVALGAFAQMQEDADRRVKELTDTIDKQTGAFTNASKAKVRDAIMGGLTPADLNLLSKAGVNFTELAGKVLEGGDALTQYRGALEKIMAAHPETAGAMTGLFEVINQQELAARDAALTGQVLARETKNTGDAAQDATGKVDGFGKATAGAGNDAQGATPKLKDYRDFVGDIYDIAKDAEQAQKDLSKAIIDVTGAAIDADGAEADYKQSLMDAAKAADELRGGVNKARTEFDLMTEAGQGKSQVMRDLATDANDYAKALLTDGVSVDTVKDKMGILRQQFIDSMVDMGLNKTAAEKLADQYIISGGKVDDLKASMDEIPAEVVSKLKLETAEAMQKLKLFRLMYDSLGNKTVTLSAVLQTQGFEAAQAYRNRFATGGYVSGPGTTTSDSIPALLSDKEYVIKAAAVSKYGKGFFDNVNAMRFAEGGYVSRGVSSASVIDYDRLASAVGSSGGTTLNAYGMDVEAAIERVMRRREFTDRV